MKKKIPSKVVIDSDIFFFALSSDRPEVRPHDVQRLLRHLSSAPSVSLFVPITVIGESTLECLVGETTPGSKHDLKELHDLIDFWASLDLKPLYPNTAAAEACFRLTVRYRRGSHRDYRLSDTDLVHLGYALGYQMDYLLTTDRSLKYYVPDKSELKVIDLEEAKGII